MSDKKRYTYRFNPQTLSYEKVEVTMLDRWKRISSTLLIGLGTGVVLAVLAFAFIDSPKEAMLKREINQYKHQLRVLNDRVNRDSEVLADLESRDSAVYRTIFEAEPVGADKRVPAYLSYEELQGFDCSEEIEQATRRIDTLTQRLYVQSLSLDELYKMAGSKQQRMAAMPAIMPVAKNRCKIVSGFGMRYHPILRRRRMHTGIDLSAHQGTPVYATADGVVTVSGRSAGFSGYGICVVVNHGFGFQTLYAHLSGTKVKNGQKVKRGELIGYVGRTGLAQGSHLHYEVIQNGNRVNPVYFFFNDLTPSEYEDVIEAANQETQCLS